MEVAPLIDLAGAGLWRLMNRIEAIRNHPRALAFTAWDADAGSVPGGLLRRYQRSADIRWT
jgi:hypothetical protein